MNFHFFFIVLFDEMRSLLTQQVLKQPGGHYGIVEARKGPLNCAKIRTHLSPLPPPRGWLPVCPHVASRVTSCRFFASVKSGFLDMCELPSSNNRNGWLARSLGGGGGNAAKFALTLGSGKVPRMENIEALYRNRTDREQQVII